MSARFASSRCPAQRALGANYIERRRVGSEWHVVAGDGDEQVVAIAVAVSHPRTHDDFFADPIALIVKRSDLVDVAELQAWKKKLTEKVNRGREE